MIWLALNPDSMLEALSLIAALPERCTRRWLVVNQSTFAVGSSELLQQTLLDCDTPPANPGEVVSLRIC